MICIILIMIITMIMIIIIIINMWFPLCVTRTPIGRATSNEGGRRRDVRGLSRRKSRQM